MTKTTLILSIPMTLLMAATAFGAKTPDPLALKRTEVKVSEEIQLKFRSPSDLLQMVTLTPLVDANDEVTCVQISEIRDPIVHKVLKARVGDCLKEVSIFREGRDGMIKEVYPVLSATDALLLYKDLNGASRIEINLQRDHKTVAMTYVVN
ncbi:hypothetical protein BH10BDE1_BH10BDE1_33780 [soil metagenome]